MKTNSILLAAILGLSGVTIQASPGANKLPQLAEQALSQDPGEASRAIEALRAAGPAGLEALQLKAPPQPLGVPRGKSAWREAMDHVSGQYDCAASRLYWFTDFAAAKAEAKRVNKPTYRSGYWGSWTTNSVAPTAGSFAQRFTQTRTLVITCGSTSSCTGNRCGRSPGSQLILEMEERSSERSPATAFITC